MNRSTCTIEEPKLQKSEEAKKKREMGEQKAEYQNQMRSLQHLPTCIFPSHTLPFFSSYTSFLFPFLASVSFSITYSIFDSVFPFSSSLSGSFSVASLLAFEVFFFISVQSSCNCRSQQEIFSLWEGAAGRISGNIPFYCC